jgi:putative LysE/RhtB family amino acid efflux pump
MTVPPSGRRAAVARTGPDPRPQIPGENTSRSPGALCDSVEMMAAASGGWVLGFLVGAQVGPIWLLCARAALRGRFRSALAIGAGAAVIDLAYACLGVAGAAGLLRITGLRLALGLVGAAVLVLLGARTIHSAFRVRLGQETEGEVDRPAAAFRTSLAATASNPSTIASWAAIFAAASTAHLARTPASTTVLLVGIGFGSMCWFAILSTGMTVVGRRFDDRGLRIIDGLSGAGLMAFGGVLAFRSLRD